MRLVGSLSVLAAALVLAVVPTFAQTAPVALQTYRLEPFSPASTKSFTPAQLGILEKLNRRDVAHLIRLTEVIVPDVWLDDERGYSPFPQVWTWAEPFPKALVVDQPAQVFAAYEQGRLVRWGPISSGRKETPTPAGAYNLTWRSKSRRSTDNEDWLLKWYFNFINERGISFHEFELPGRAASHACVRLLSRDAEWLYGWGEQWTLSPDKRTVATPGTPVVILGAFDFANPAPWLVLDWWRALLALPADPKAAGR